MTDQQSSNRDRIRAASFELIHEIASLNPDLPGISGYYKEYLKRIISHVQFYGSIYRNHLLYAVRDIDKPLKDLTIIDYGAGCGLMSVLAKKAGFGKVICNDIYDVSVKDAQIIARAIGTEADIYFTGDMADLASQNFSPDIIVGMDVIEHIYNLDEFFESAAKLNSTLQMCFGTGSNPYNPLVASRLKAVMNKLEFHGSGKGLKERDSKEAYASIRKRIINKTNPGIINQFLDQAVSETRGMNEADILRYIESGKVSQARPAIRDNTCDPLTGNWAERLLYEEEYSVLASTHGFRLKWINGSYDCYNKNLLKTGLIMSLNALIRKLGKPGRKISPYAYLVFSRQDLT